MRAIALTAALLAAQLAAPAERIAAQQPTPVAPGARVRVTVAQRSAPRYVGTLDTLTPDTLALRVEHRFARAPVAIPVGSITRLEVSRARGFCSEARALCLVSGGILGIGAGVVTAYALEAGGRYPAWAAGLLTVPLGFFVGISVGGTIAGDRWERVPLPARR